MSLSITEAGFLYSALDEVADDYINELIPYNFVEGKNHGKKGKWSVYNF